MRARHRGWAARLLAGAAGLAAIGPVLLGTASPAAAATTWDVSATNNTFKPNYLNIKPGDRVLWTNQDNTVHSVTSDQGDTTFDTDLGKRGATFERRFDTAGTYTYHCKYHSSMVGTIDVGVPATTTTTTPPPAPTTTTTATTAPPTTTTTAPATTTTSEPTTTTTAPRPAAGPVPVPVPPAPGSAAAAPPPSSSTTTSAPPSTTTTTVPPTTATSAPPALAGGEPPAPPPPAPATPPTSAGKTDTGDKTAAGPPAGPGGDLDVGAIALVSALVAVGAFAAWTLIRVRPGRV